MPAGRPTIRSRRVATELRRLRRERGISSVAVAKALGVTPSKISRIENNKIGLKVDEVAAMLGLYHVPEQRRKQLLDLVRRAEEPGWWQAHGSGLPELWQTLIEFEERATRIVNYEPLVVPGLLQTSEYARAVILGTAGSLPDKELDTKVVARLGRQAILSRAEPPEMEVLLYEPVLRVPVGGQGVMHRQLRTLVDASARPNVTVRVVPLSAGAHPGLDGTFVFLEFADEPMLVHLENWSNSAFLEEDHHLESYRLALQGLQDVALAPDASAAMIAAVAEEYG